MRPVSFTRKLNFQEAGSLVWLPQTYLLLLYLTFLPSGKKIFTPISNQEKVLAPFKFQLKLQALPTNFVPHLSVLPTIPYLSPSRIRTLLGWGGTIYSCSWPVFFFFRRYYSPIDLQGLFFFFLQGLLIYSRHFWRNVFLILWIIICLRHFTIFRSLELLTEPNLSIFKCVFYTDLMFRKYFSTPKGNSPAMFMTSLLI